MALPELTPRELINLISEAFFELRTRMETVYGDEYQDSEDFEMAREALDNEDGRTLDEESEFIIAALDPNAR